MAIDNALSFGEFSTNTLTWDGDKTGREIIFDYLIKLSDAIVTKADLVNGYTIEAVENGVCSSVTIPDDAFLEDTGDVINIYTGEIADNAPVLAIFLTGDAAGIYAFDYSVVGLNMYVSKFTIPNYTGFPVTKKIDEKYLPKSALQPDWNQIANKPFEDMEVVLYDKVGIVPVEEDGAYVIQEPSDLQFVYGNQYIFAFDGVEYTTDVFLLYGRPFGVGNPALMGSGDDNGLPFVAIVYDGNLVISCLSHFNSLSISVIEAKKIDERYLPGAIILYRNNGESGNTDPYLYKKNTGNESDRLTSVELYQFVNSGRTIYVNVNGILMTPVQINLGEFARVTIFTGTTGSLTNSYYTAEYTPAT